MGQYYKTVFIKKVRNGIRIIGWLHGHHYHTSVNLGTQLGEKFVSAIEFQISPDGTYPNGHRIVWAGDYSDNEKGSDINLNSMCTDDFILLFPVKDASEYRYIVNHSQKLFVDKENIEEYHPLPLLTCEGNGRGGGDYNGKDPQHLVGSWSRDMIAVTREPPEGYLEVYFDLTELNIEKEEPEDGYVSNDDYDDYDDYDDDDNNDCDDEEKEDSTNVSK